MITGLSSVNSERLIDTILENGESVDSFEFPTEIVKHQHEGTMIKIRSKKGNGYYFKMIRVAKSGKVTYMVSFLPGDNEEQNYYARETIDDFSNVVLLFKKWLDIIKGLQHSASNIQKKIQTASNISLPEPEPIQIPTLEIDVMNKDENEKQLIKLLPFDARTSYLYDKHETQVLEYKEIFEWENKVSRAKYIKTLANFVNRDGGYIVFGINDDGKITGINISEFDNVNNVEIQDYINSYFTGNILVGRLKFKLNEYDLAAFYVGKAPAGKIIKCTRDFQDLKGKSILEKDGTYYRQNGGNDKMPFEIMQEKINARTNLVSKIDDTVRRNDVKPEFNATAMHSDRVKLHLTNIGMGRAKILSVENADDKNNTVVTGATHGYVEKGQFATVWGTPININRTEIRFHTTLIFEDIDGRRYRQNIRVNGAGGAEIDDVVPIFL